MLAVMCVAKSVIDYLLFFRLNGWKIKNSVFYWFKFHIHWIILSVLTVCVYISFRLVFFSTSTITLYQFLTSVYNLDFQLLFLSISKSYLGDSGLIRNAENPYATLVGQEKILSLLVNKYVNIFIF